MKIVLFDHFVLHITRYVYILYTGIVKMLSLHLSGWHAQRSCPGEEMWVTLRHVGFQTLCFHQTREPMWFGEANTICG